MESKHIPDKTLASVCGLFCKACGIYTATKENNLEALKRISERTHIPFEDIRCEGCRSETRTAYCKNCVMVSCAKEKGLEFCGECEEYPCTSLKTFQSQLPHRVELYASQERIKQVGWENWYLEMISHFSCENCSSLNGWYDFTCKSCGTAPGSPFVKAHAGILRSPN